MKRYGRVIHLKPGCLEKYKEYHANPWPEVREGLTARNIHNYSIYHHDGFLFSYFEYTGDDLKSEFKRPRAARPPGERDWHRIMTEMQQPVDSAGPDDWWVEMEEVFHLD